MLKSKQSSVGGAELKSKDDIDEEDEANKKLQINEEHRTLSSQKEEEKDEGEVAKEDVGLTQGTRPSIREERKGRVELRRFEREKLSTSALKRGKQLEYWSSKEWAELRERLTKTQMQMKTEKLGVTIFLSNFTIFTNVTIFLSNFTIFTSVTIFLSNITIFTNVTIFLSNLYPSTLMYPVSLLPGF